MGPNFGFRKEFLLKLLQPLTTKTMIKRLLINFLMSCRDLFIFFPIHCLLEFPVVLSSGSQLASRKRLDQNLEGDPQTVSSTNHVLSFRIFERISLNEKQNEIKLCKASKVSKNFDTFT